jgi:hypothetical protein
LEKLHIVERNNLSVTILNVASPDKNGQVRPHYFRHVVYTTIVMRLEFNLAW